jgi:hypothetical protein
VIAEITVLQYEIGFSGMGVSWQAIDYKLVNFQFQSPDH